MGLPDESNLSVSTPALRGNLARAAVKAIPYIGESLDHLIYGRLDDARWNRLEQTLGELGEKMKERGIPPTETAKEDFGQLLEDVSPQIARATNDLKREMLRDLLLNAVTLPPNDAGWEAARLAADILARIDYAGLEILASLWKLGAKEGGPKTDVVVPPDGTPAVELRDNRDRRIELSFDRFVVDRGYRQITDVGARLAIVGAHGRDRYEQVTLTALGQFVLKWAMSDEPSSQPATF